MEFSLITKPGDRDINEDFIEVIKDENRKIFILADGLGGHGHGEIASKEATNAVIDYFMANNEDDITLLLNGCFQAAHSKLKEMQKQIENTSFFKTTLVLLIIADDCCVWGNIGDSRIYHFESQKLIERSMDHSVPQMLVNAGKIKERNIRYHEDRSRLTKVVGSEESVIKPFINCKEPFTKETVFLLCTDGFWEFINEKKMQKELKKANTVEEWISRMEKIIIKNGKGKKMDNYSAIAIFF